MPAVPARVGRYGTGVAALLGLAGVPLCAGRWPLLAAAAAWLLVLAQGRSWLAWLSPLPAARTVRRLVRVAVFFYPLPFFGVHYRGLPLLGLAAGLLVGLLALGTQWRAVRLGLSHRYLTLLGPTSTGDRLRDLIVFGGAGAAQEYLYHDVGLAAAVPVVGTAGAVALTAAAFVLEHLLQFNADESWDLRDVVTHAALGLGLGVLVLATGSVLAAVLAHTVYNLPQVLQTLLRESDRPRRSRRGPSRTEEADAPS